MSQPAEASAPPRRGLMLILSSPSGAGKTTLTRNLLQTPGVDLSLSISVTTRPRRPSEADGIHYHFIDLERFEEMRARNALLESARVHGNQYGTPRAPVQKALAAGRDMLFDIDTQGARQLREAAPDDVVSVFILPPSMAELRARLERRAEDSPDVIARRLENARIEIDRWTQYDYVLVNRDLGESLANLRAILTSERLRAARTAPGVTALVAELLAQA